MRAAQGAGAGYIATVLISAIATFVATLAILALRGGTVTL
jgi:hypothetical protein